MNTTLAVFCYSTVTVWLQFDEVWLSAALQHFFFRGLMLGLTKASQRRHYEKINIPDDSIFDSPQYEHTGVGCDVQL